jgi:uncharacterized DUF497 family protein
VRWPCPQGVALGWHVLLLRSNEHQPTCSAIDAEIFHLEESDDAHSIKEDRYTTLASHPMERALVLKILWTERWKAGRRIARIISARRATRKERILYEKAIIQGE